MSRHGSGKTSIVQTFPGRCMDRWKKGAPSEKVLELLMKVWSGKTVHVQLESLKMLLAEGSEECISVSLLKILVEMHAVCLSRHPLQRAIASYLQNVPDCHGVTVVEYIHSTIGSILKGGGGGGRGGIGDCGGEVGGEEGGGEGYGEGYGGGGGGGEGDGAEEVEWIGVNPSHCLQYFESLGENFALGELALCKQLPLVIEFCVSVLDTCHRQNVLTDSLFLAVLKTFMAILHKTQSLVSRILSGEFSFFSSSNITTTTFSDSNSSEAVVSWSARQAGWSVEVKVQWVTRLLQRTRDMCEDLLKRDGGVPHDLSLTAAMLLVVIVLRTSPDPDCLNTTISSLVIDWLITSGSPLHHTFSRLAMSHALLAKLPPHLLIVNVRGEPCLLALFPIMCKLFDSFTETSCRYIAARTLALWTTTARDCISHIEKESGVLYESLLPSGSIISSLLKYVWALWEDPVDGIRHQCRVIFENVIGIGQKLQDTERVSPSPFLLSLTESLLSLTSPTRGKYQLLSTLSHHLPVSTLLSSAPSLPGELLGVMGHQALACHAGELWSRLVKLHWEEEKGQRLCGTWKTIWVEKLVEFMVSATPLSRQHAIQHCLPVLFECCPDAMELIRSCLTTIAPTGSGDAVLMTKLACLRCAKNRVADLLWDKNHERTFISATHHKDEQIQLSALGVLCESVRSTEPPPPSSLPLLLTFLQLNGSTQSPNFRYPIITAVKKLLLRIRESSYAMKKLFSKGKAPDPQFTIATYQNFLQKLMDQQFSYLHPFSSYQRRHMALSVLQLLSNIFPKNQCPRGSYTNDRRPLLISPVFEFPGAVSENQAKRLVLSMRDSYDANRALVLDLLSSLSSWTLGLEDSKFMEYLTGSFYKIVCSPKAVDCTTASYVLRLLLRKNPNEFVCLLREHISTSSDDMFEAKSTVSSFHWETITLLIHILVDQLESARHDLLSASVRNPLYGVMQSLRVTMEEAKGMSYNIEVCRAGLTRVIDLCGEIAAIASPVVCNSSPEGFLPGAPGLPVSNGLDTPTVKGAGAQSLLLCCWHAMKETSLLMGLVVEWAPIGNGPTSLISIAQVNCIAEIFNHQLTEARHRGAFEMAHTGFQKLCHSLWTSTSQSFQKMPGEWVKELLDSLQSKSMSRLLSITRRSAGLPFYLQAILTSEPGHTGRPCLKETMKTLLSVTSDCLMSGSMKPLSNEQKDDSALIPDSSSENSVQPHTAAVHALNILRALYRDSRLGEHIISFIPDGVQIAVCGFSSPLWPVRNSSTLLFSALVMRIFGAKRVQDEHSIENKMTAREFFTRFPSLHGFLRDELQKAATELNYSGGKEFQLPSLFPVLLILTRLYPTTLDEPSSATSLHSFLPLLLQCSSCNVWKTRVLISRSVVLLLTPHTMETLLHRLLSLLTTENQNSLHTALLILERMVIERRDLLESSSRESNSESSSWLSLWLMENLLKKNTLGTDYNPCPVTRCAYLDLLASVMSHLKHKTSELPVNIVQPLLDAALEKISNTSKVGGILQDDILVSGLHLLLNYESSVAISSDDSSRVQQLCQRCLTHPNVAVKHHTLLYINNERVLYDDSVVRILVEQFSSIEDESLLALVCDSLIRERKKISITVGQELCTVALQHIVKRHQSLELRVVLMSFLSSMIETSFNTEMVTQWLSIAKDYILPTVLVELRQAVASGLGKLWKVLIQEESVELVEPYTRLVVALLQDGDEEVRDDMATSVGVILSSLYKYFGNTIQEDMMTQTPSSSSALQSYLSFLPLILHQHPNTVLTILLGLIDLESIEQQLIPREETNVLFEEDPLNNYFEEITVVSAACLALEKLLSNHATELYQSTESLTKLLHSIYTAINSIIDSNTIFSPWDQQDVFLGMSKVFLVSRAMKNVLKTDGAHEKLLDLNSKLLL